MLSEEITEHPNNYFKFHLVKMRKNNNYIFKSYWKTENSEIYTLTSTRMCMTLLQTTSKNLSQLSVYRFKLSIFQTFLKIQRNFIKQVIKIALITVELLP